MGEMVARKKSTAVTEKGQRRVLLCYGAYGSHIDVHLCGGNARADLVDTVPYTNKSASITSVSLKLGL